MGKVVIEKNKMVKEEKWKINLKSEEKSIKVKGEEEDNLK